MLPVMMSSFIVITFGKRAVSRNALIRELSQPEKPKSSVSMLANLTGFPSEDVSAPGHFRAANFKVNVLRTGRTKGIE